MYVLFVTAGHYYVEGVGYSTIQAILTGDVALPSLLILLCSSPSSARPRSASARARRAASSRRRCSWARRSAAHSALCSTYYPVEGVGIATCAMIGMAAMVGGGTGAAMTAVTMIFEMTPRL